MAKIGNPSAIMKELLSNLLKYANPILNTVLGFKATGSKLCMWLWTLSNDLVYSSLFVNQTSHHSRAHFTLVCFWSVCFYIYIYIKFQKLRDNPCIFWRNNAKTGNQRKLRKWRDQMHHFLNIFQVTMSIDIVYRPQ